MKRPHLWLALALLIAVNAVVLTGVARNRSGAPDAAPMLTERELVLDVAAPREENSGLSLQLDWRNEAVPEWFDAKKLAELGFDVAVGEDDLPARRGRELPLEAFVVLEYQGEAWERHARRQKSKLDELQQKLERGEIEEKQAERERRRLAGDLAAGSRLFAVDSGHDPQVLRSRYPDGKRYIIAAAPVRPTHRREEERHILRGAVQSILVDRLHVPRDLAAPLLVLPHEGRLYRGDTYLEPGDALAPRYEVEVRWGKRYEPWIVGVSLLGPSRGGK